MNDLEYEIKKLKDRVTFLEESFDKVLKVLELHTLSISQIVENLKKIGGIDK